MNEANKDTSLYTTITEQQGNIERNVYDELTGNESYETVLMKEKQGNNEKLYEKLQKSQSDDNHGQRDSNELKQMQSPIDDRSMLKATGEYANTFF